MTLFSGVQPGVQLEVSGFRSQVSGLRSQVSSLRSQISGLGSQVSGLRSQVSDLRSQVSGLMSRSLDVFGVSLGLFGGSQMCLLGPQGVPGGWVRQSGSSEFPASVQVQPNKPIRHDLSNVSFLIIR